jgi:hypothetical protein
MLSEKEINLVLGKDLVKREKKEELTFRDWLTVKGIAALTVKHTISYVNHMLRENNTPFPKRDDAEKIRLKILDPNYSKSYQKHLLTALELYMEYTDQPIKFKKPPSMRTSITGVRWWRRCTRCRKESWARQSGPAVRTASGKSW